MARDIDLSRRSLDLVIGLAVGALLIAAVVGAFVLGSEPAGFTFLLVIGSALILLIAITGALYTRVKLAPTSKEERAYLSIEMPEAAPPSEADVIYPDSSIRSTAAEQNAHVPEHDPSADKPDPVAAELRERESLYRGHSRE